MPANSGAVEIGVLGERAAHNSVGTAYRDQACEQAFFDPGAKTRVAAEEFESVLRWR